MPGPFPTKPEGSPLWSQVSLLIVVYRNWDLHVTSSCHRISIYSINRSRPQTAKRLAELEKQGKSILPITQPLEMSLETDEEWLAQMKLRGGRDPKE